VAEELDLVILGSGPGGYVAAIRAAQWGLRTVVVEKESWLGGTCLNVGCIPTKALLFNAEVLEYMQHAKEFGINVGPATSSWEVVRERQNRVVLKHNKGVEYLLKKNKVELIRGYGRLLGKGRIEVESGSGKQELLTRNIILATGSEARIPHGMEPDGKLVLTNREILETKTVPKSLIIIGAGAVGVEFGSVYQRFGSQVTVVEMLPRILPLADEEISKELQRVLKKQGIQFLTGAKVEKLTRLEGDSVQVDVAIGEKKETLKGEQVLVAVGRKPNTENVGLEKTKAEVERGFVKTDHYMATAEPGLYAIGDIVAGAPQLAHAASMEGIVAVGRMCDRPVPPMNFRQIPDAVYCDPQVASVGLSEAKARELGHDVKIGKFPFKANSKASVLGEEDGFVKLVCDKKYGEILGAHMIGAGVTELIGEMTMAIRMEATLEDLQFTVHAHPTLSEAILDAAGAADNIAINI
jgi:dihydrolipoamide dehydrogenase